MSICVYEIYHYIHSMTHLSLSLTSPHDEILQNNVYSLGIVH